jgi:glycosyltransferase involved in cell wall biosynthesis
MKILMIAPTPFFSDRGCHTRIYNQIKGLQELGHDIILCTYGLGNDVDGIVIKRTINFPWYRKLSAGPSMTKILLLPCLLITVLKQICHFKPDIVHAFLHEGAIIARVCKMFYNSTYVFDYQGSLAGEIVQHKFVKENGWLHRLFQLLEKWINSWFPIITNSDQLHSALIKSGRKAPILNAMDSVDTSMFCPMPKDLSLAKSIDVDTHRPTIMYMGLLETYQGADILFDAFSQVVNKLPNSLLLVIGFPNIDKYQNLCEKLNIAQNVHFLGKVNYWRIPSYLSLSRIAIAPKISKHEGDGKLYNYMAMGMATVTVDRSVSREILGCSEDSPTALFASFGDCSDLAVKMIALLKDDKLTEQIGLNARNRAVHVLSYEVQAKKIHDFYQCIKR